MFSRTRKGEERVRQLTAGDPMGKHVSTTTLGGGKEKKRSSPLIAFHFQGGRRVTGNLDGPRGETIPSNAIPPQIPFPQGEKRETIPLGPSANVKTNSFQRVVHSFTLGKKKIADGERKEKAARSPTRK